MNLKQLATICISACMFYQFSYKPDYFVSTTQTMGTKGCVFVNWPAGWGNTLLSFLNNAIKTSRYNGTEAVFPCVRGYGELFGKLFQNLKQCPLEYPVDVCTGHPSRKGKAKIDWKQIKRVVKGNSFPTLLQLNATFVDEVFVAAGASFTLEDLKRSSCAVHVRFGDFYFRDSDTEAGKAKLEKEQRACKDPKNVSACFERLIEMVRDKCPDPDVPIYVATDFSNFTRYFCSNEEKRTILSSCKEESIVIRATHSNDIELINRNTTAMNGDALSAFMGLLSDWLALALAQKLSQVSHSTFSDTALLNFYA
jgi:hypothetical protein